MKAQYVHPTRTPAKPDVVSNAYHDAIWELTELRPGPEAVAVLHAHGALETGHFDQCFNGNAGNIKATEGYSGFFTCIELNEILKVEGKRTAHWFAPEGILMNEKGVSAPRSKGGKVVGQPLPVPDGHPYTRMRAYPTLADGIKDKIKFLLGLRWIHCLDYAHAGDPAGYVESIRDMGYFTADLAPYSKAVSLLYRKFLPVAKETVSHPISLHPHEEQAIEECVAACSRVDPAYGFQPGPNWGAVRADRDRDIAEANQ